MGTCTDIEDRKQADEAVHRSEQRFRSIIEKSLDAVILFRADGTVSYASPASARLLGYEPGNLPGQNGYEFVHPDDAAHVRAVYQELGQRPGQSVTATYRLKDWEGAWRWIEARGTNLLAEPDVQAVVVTYRDVTREHKAAAEIADWERRYETAIKATGHVLYDWDGASDTVQWGGNSEQVLGYRLDELPVTLPGWVELVHPDDRARFVQACEQNYPTREPFHLEYRVRRKDGRFIYTNDKGHFLSSDRQNSRVVGFLSDVTAARQIEEQYRQAQKMEAIGKLAGGIAHDFNNLLTIINGYSEIVLGMLDPREQPHSLVGEVKKAGERAAGLTRQLLAFSRRQMLHQRTLNLNAVVNDLGKMLHRVLGEDIELVLKPGRSLMKVHADPGQLEQVIMNLAVNARDAMPTGGTLVIETANAEFSSGRGADGAEIRPGRYVALTVSDTGCGIPDEIREHIYEPFFTTKKAGQGTGLGLATLYGIVRQSGGHVSFESQVGRGTTFRILLPAVGDASSFTEKTAASNDPPGGQETILLVEDEDGVRGMTRLLLQRLGYEDLEAANAEEALAAFRTSPKPVELLLTDVVMPGLSGRAIAEQLRALDSRLRVVFMSGYTDDAVVRHGVEQDEVHFLAKPYTATALANTVRAAIDRSAV